MKQEQRVFQTSLETANEMWKDAFRIKKARFKNQNPKLSDRELEATTVEYFRKLGEKESAW